jgi:hypothetical protein
MRLEGDFHQRGASAGGVVLGSKINLPFCQRCTRGFEFLGLVWGFFFGCGYLSSFWVGTYWVLSLGFQVGLPMYTF